MRNSSITHITRFTVFCFSLLTHTCFADVSNEARDPKQEYMDFIDRLKNRESGLVVASDKTCGNCIAASSAKFQEILARETSMPVFFLNTETDFGRAFSMKYRIHRQPAFLVVNSRGQVLQKSYDFPRDDKEMRMKGVFEDTLPPVKEPLNFDVSEYPDFYQASFGSASFQQPGENELRAFLERSEGILNPVTWAVISRFAVADSIMSKAVDAKDELIEKYGKQEVEDVFNDHLYELIKKSVRSGRHSVREITDQCYRMFEEPESKECSFKFQSYFFQLKGDWYSFVELGNRLALNADENRNQLVSMAATLLRSGVNEEKLGTALSWMKMPMDEMSLKELEIKASLSFRTGLREEAKTTAEAAILKARELGKDAPSSTYILEELRK